MALTIKPMLKGASLSRKSGRQPYHVSGLSGADPSVMWPALTAGGLPQPGQLHPVATGLKVLDAEVVEMLGNFDCVVMVTYGPSEQQPPGGGSGEGVIEVDSSIVSVQTMIDTAGQPIKVIYNPGINAVGAVFRDPNIAAGDIAMTATVEKFLPMVTVRVTREEVGPPLANAKLFVGKTNSTNLFDDDDIEAYLCTRIGGTRNYSTTDKYNVTYEFQAPEDGWLKVAGYIDPTTNQVVEKNIGTVTPAPTRPLIRMSVPGVPQDRSLNGITIVRVQGTADFGALNLPTL